MNLNGEDSGFRAKEGSVMGLLAKAVEKQMEEQRRLQPRSR